MNLGKTKAVTTKATVGTKNVVVDPLKVKFVDSKHIFWYKYRYRKRKV